jgi:hypothetical protein
VYRPPQGPYQPHPQAPAYPPQQPANLQPYAPQGYGQPSEGIAINTQFFPMSFMLLMFKPKISVDGYEAPPAGWGRSVVPARPGPHHVHVHVPYFLPPQFGPADTTVDVYPGRLTELEYKAPVWAFSGGSLGPAPQSYKGIGILIAVMAIPLLLAVVFPLIVLLTSP